MTVMANPAKEERVSVESSAASCSSRLSSTTASPPAINSAWLRADWNRAVGRHVPGDQREMRAGAGIGTPLGVECGQRIEPLGVKQILERDQTIGCIAAKAANVADRENLGGDLHRQIVVIDGADPSAHDQCMRP